MAPGSLRAALVGNDDPGLERLLADVMAEVGLEVSLVPLGDAAQIVFAVVTRENVVEAVVAARKATRAPIVALLSVGDERVARRAIDCGAQACYALDTPLELLRFQLLTLATDVGREPAQSRPAPRPFELGARARHVIAELRRTSGRNTYPGFWVAPDAESRLEAAIRADVGRSPSRPFKLGIYGRLETTLMRLDARAIARLEQAIDEDLALQASRVA